MWGNVDSVYKVELNIDVESEITYNIYFLKIGSQLLGAYNLKLSELE